MFLAWETYEKQLRIEKTRLSHQVWSHGGSTFKKKRTLNGHFPRPAETDPYMDQRQEHDDDPPLEELTTRWQSHDYVAAGCLLEQADCTL